MAAGALVEGKGFAAVVARAAELTLLHALHAAQGLASTT
jgi:hypothetical protein